jgi:hypothetical protein
MKPDALIDQAAAPPCKSLIHRVPEEAAAVLQRARQRAQAGEKLNYSRLSEIINREYGTDLVPSGLRQFLKGPGCRCD